MSKTTIEVQMEKVFKHTRQNSFATRDRYYHSCKGFVSFLNERYKLQNIRNIADKHVVAYITQRQQEGIGAKTIKNDLAAIRYFHDQIGNAKHTLSANQGLKEQYHVKLEATPVLTGNRSWTEQEYREMQTLCQQNQQHDLADSLTLIKTMGFRISECVAMRRSQAEEALRSGVYTIKGEAKNGKHRAIKLSTEAKGILERRLVGVERGQRLFVRSDEQVHQVVNRLEKSLAYYRGVAETLEGQMQRPDLRTPGETKALSFHGLRYNYVQHRMQEEQNKGFSPEQAALNVTVEVGHHRTDVIAIYNQLHLTP